MVKQITATSQATVDAPLEQVWAVMAQDFAGIEKWSSGVNASVGSAPPVNGSDHGERACKIAAAGFSDTKERIIEFEPMSRIRYSLYDGLPGFVQNAINGWHFSEENGRTHVRGQTDMEIKGIMGVLMGGFMKKNLTRVLSEMAEEAKHYIEHGEPHPRKKKAMAKFAKKQRKSR